MIGRQEEAGVLEDCLHSGRPEFLALYGRRRVGKTYLIKEHFRERFAFYATGVPGLNTRRQLRVFSEALSKYGDTDRKIPRDWFEAFSRLEKILSGPDVERECSSGKKVVFLDELPWMDTARSDFKGALDYFWNSWGSSQKDLLLIVCGSATSWIINNIVMDTGGLYNRITRQIWLQPFCLSECEQLLAQNGVPFSRRQIVECYMIFGGIPYYLNYLKPQRSLAQNVEMLFFQENAPLQHEFDRLFSSLFKKADRHIAIIETLSKVKSGMTRTDLAKHKGIGEGKELTRCLSELEQCGFIRKYKDFTKEKSGCFYQLVDSFALFHLTFLKHRRIESWIDFTGTPAYYGWGGLAFERVCLLHTKQIKNALGIRGISSQDFSWRSRRADPGVQIDLLIDRKDDAVNVCETKYTQGEYAITASYEKELLHKAEAFRQESGTRKSLLLTMITMQGIKNNAYKGTIVCELTAEDLFREL